MKTKFLWIAGAAMVAALVSCTKDVESTAPDGGLDTIDGTTAYAKLDIRLGNPGTRAEGFNEDGSRNYGDPDTDAGTPDERKISTVMLAIYNNDGDLIGYGSTGLGNGVNGSDHVSDKFDTKVVKLEMVGKRTDDEGMTVVAFANTTKAPLEDFDIAAVSTTDEIGSLTNGLVMTNSGYFETETSTRDGKTDGIFTASWEYSNWVVGTPIEKGSLYASQEAAENGDAQTIIYVERMAAKVNVALKPNAPTNADVDIYSFVGAGDDKASAVKYTLDFNPKKWAASGTAKKMYWLKNSWQDERNPEKLNHQPADWGETTVGHVWADPWKKKINDANHHRSYWAKGVYYDGPYKGMQDNLNYVSYSQFTTDATKGLDFNTPTYIPEHTYGNNVILDTDGLYNEIGAATGVMVLGQYQVKNSTGSTVNTFGATPDFYLLQEEKGEGDAKDRYTIFTQEELIQYIAEASVGGRPIFNSNDGNGSRISGEWTSVYDLNWDSKKAQYTISVKSANSTIPLYVQKEDGTYELLDNETQTYISSNARHYNEGYAYFYTAIQHFAESGIGKYGVVRNHSYNLTVNKFLGLGTPLDDNHFGPDEDKPIIPDPETVAFIHAELDVLSWNKVEQGIDW